MCDGPHEEVLGESAPTKSNPRNSRRRHLPQGQSRPHQRSWHQQRAPEHQGRRARPPAGRHGRPHLHQRPLAVAAVVVLSTLLVNLTPDRPYTAENIERVNADADVPRHGEAVLCPAGDAFYLAEMNDGVFLTAADLVARQPPGQRRLRRMVAVFDAAIDTGIADFPALGGDDDDDDDLAANFAARIFLRNASLRPQRQRRAVRATDHPRRAAADNRQANQAISPSQFVNPHVLSTGLIHRGP